MFNSNILDVALGVAFVFLLVSTICSAVREAIEHILKTRAAFLEYAVREMLRDRQGTGLAGALFNHPMVSGLYAGDYKPRSGDQPKVFPWGRGLPSYIPAKSFALALMDIAMRGPTLKPSGAEADLVTDAYRSLREGVGRMENAYVQRALLMALDASQGDVERARENIEAWYDGVMDRVSGWYKRATQGILFGIALIVSVALNVDTVQIARTLYRDPTVRSYVVAVAEKSPAELGYEQALGTLGKLGLPVGWSWMSDPDELKQLARENKSLPDAKEPTPESWWRTVRRHLAGWLLTAFAATLGAPFWFDILNKVMVIRSTVKPREKSPEEGSEDRKPRTEPRSTPAPAGVAVPPSAAPPPLQHEHEHEDADPCGAPIFEATRDEDLPPARGGVG